MGGQIESNHFFRFGDTIRGSDGQVGVVIEEWSLYAIVEWRDGRREEIDQLDPEVTVVDRARPE